MKSDYQAYLLRFQRTSNQTNWRVMLKDAVTGEMHHFAHEREALRYLLQMLADDQPTDNKETLPE